jgi:hypothetical protein
LVCSRCRRSRLMYTGRWHRPAGRAAQCSPPAGPEASATSPMACNATRNDGRAPAPPPRGVPPSSGRLGVVLATSRHPPVHRLH